MGPSGCGKSTLLNLLGLLDVPDEGKYLFCGEETTRQTQKKRTELRKAKIGFVFQSFNLIDDLTVQENIELPLKYMKVPSKDRTERSNKLMQRLGIDHRSGYFPQQLSGGQQQRVAVARALATDPEIILADEPTGNLDSAHGLDIMKLLVELNAQGTTIVMVTHSAHDAQYAGRIIRMLDGQIVGENRQYTDELS